MNDIIRCPKCNWEYLPGEIFIPSQLIGQPKDIERTVDGKIDTYYGIYPDKQEQFCCEHCGCALLIKADIKYSVTHDIEHDFSDDFISNKYPSDRLTLFEG